MDSAYSPGSPFMRMPAELRLMIYAYLFDAGDADLSTDTTDNPNSGTGLRRGTKSDPLLARTISIRNGESDTPFLHAECNQCVLLNKGYPNTSGNNGNSNNNSDNDGGPSSERKKSTRTRYHVIDRSFNRRCVETTYYMTNKDAHICAALMRVNSAIYAETAPLVYGAHTFDFGCDVEAVKPFMSDLLPETRGLVKRLALYKKGPWLYDCWSDRCEWRTMCTYLRDHASIQHLRLVVQAGRLAESRESEWGEDEGPRELSQQDISLLVDIRHDTLHWVGDVVRLKGLTGVEVVPDFCTVPPPQTSNMFVFLAFSASVDKGFREFLNERLSLTS
ncbi:hypothetical protein F4678DRAFT_447214 [Xylaria arbuscula]|nr:hypothetical protein F4678DRAFT_447214 [Xylaria arbuscula]